MSMLKLAGIGNLGKDAVVNSVGGKTVINFSFAHTHSYIDGQGTKIEKTQWVECSQWTEKTGIAPYLKKGQQVYVEGQPEVVTYPKNDGSTGISLRCRVSQIQLCGKAPESGAPAQGGAYVPPAAAPAVPMGTTPLDDLPF